jgi:threonine dehydrogenase-like Zn-dependent dehydrogenase
LGPWAGLPWLEYPLEPGGTGHEAWGVVDWVGSDVRTLQVGDRIAALSYHAYAEYDVADEQAVVKLPSELDGRPFPGEPIGCALNVFARSGIRADETIAVVGIGFMGALLTRLASAAGARVLAISRRPYALETARKLGAAETIPMEDHGSIIARVSELTSGSMCDRVIEAVGAQWPLDLAAELTRERGTLIVAGYHQDGPRQVNMQMWNWRGFDVINAHERAMEVYVRGIREGVEAVETGRLEPDALLTHSYALEELGSALDATECKPSGFMKAWVTP